jgi:general secretion pathway protein G
MARSRKNPMTSFRSPALSAAGESLPRAKPSGSSREPFQTDPLPKKQSRGFTLIELMIVISVILILVSVALPAYNQSIWRARESVLKQNLFALRSVISQYTLDKQKAPQSLEDLVSAQYFKQIPIDPMTGRNDSWTVEEETDTIMTVDQKEPGIFDVHSGSTAVGSDGTAYNTW